jgi:hypothetical protein
MLYTHMHTKGLSLSFALVFFHVLLSPFQRRFRRASEDRNARYGGSSLSPSNSEEAAAPTPTSCTRSTENARLCTLLLWTLLLLRELLTELLLPYLVEGAKAAAPPPPPVEAEAAEAAWSAFCLRRACLCLRASSS